MSQEDYDLSMTFKLQTHFSSAEMAGLMNLLRKYVNPNATYCPGCLGTFSKNKIEYFSWFTTMQPKIIEELNQVEVSEVSVKKEIKKKI